MSIHELYQARLAEIDQRVAGQLSNVTGAKTRFSDILEQSMNPRALQVVEASPPDGEVVLSQQDATDPMQAMMSMMSSSMMLGSMSALGGDSGGSSGSGMGSTMSTMMSMMMMQQLFDRLDKLAAEPTAETAPTEDVASAAAPPIIGAEAAQAQSEDEAAQAVSEAEAIGEVEQTSGAVTAKPTKYDSVIQNAALRYQVDTDLIHGVIHAESGYRTGVVSSQGAIGIMQLMPDTASELGVRDPYDPEQNIQGGVAYLSRMLERFNGDEKLALAAYNCGPNRVESYNITDSSDPQQYQRLPQSVRNYVEKVMDYADGRAIG